MRYLIAPIILLLASLASAQQQPVVRPKDVREVAKAGAAIPKLAGYIVNQDRDVRIEAVKQIAELGTVRCLDPLVAATRDSDSEIQIRATEGLVNFYVPGTPEDRTRRDRFARSAPISKAISPIPTIRLFLPTWMFVPRLSPPSAPW